MRLHYAVTELPMSEVLTAGAGLEPPDRPAMSDPQRVTRHSCTKQRDPLSCMG